MRAKYAIVVTGRYQSCFDVGDATVWLRPTLEAAELKRAAEATNGYKTASIYRLVAVTKPKRKSNAKG